MKVNRRTEFCDAAIRVLGQSGAQGLSHFKVDDELKVARGSTSYYFQTMSELLEAVFQRISTLDKNDLARCFLEAQDPTEIFAHLIHEWLVPPKLVRTRARHELFLIGSRDASISQQIARTREEMVMSTSAIIQENSNVVLNSDFARDIANIGIWLVDGIMLTTVRENCEPPTVDQIRMYLQTRIQAGLNEQIHTDRIN